MLRTSPSRAEGAGSIPGQGPKIPHALQSKNQNVNQKQYCNKFKKDFKNGPHKKKFFFKAIIRASMLVISLRESHHSWGGGKMRNMNNYIPHICILWPSTGESK